MKTSTVKKQLLITTLFVAAITSPAYAATPVPLQLDKGVSLTQTTNITTVTQTGGLAKNTWYNIDTKSGEILQFVMPSANAVSLNKVTSGQATQFLGALKSNVGSASGATGGRIVIQNDAGITFAAGSQVNVGALVATTAKTVEDMSQDSRYVNLRFSDSKGAIANNGNINANFVALVAPSVTNNGSIKTTTNGRIDLAATDAKFTVQMFGVDSGANSNTGIFYEASGKTLAAANVTNTGTLEARGGYINIKADGAKTIAQSVINLNGIVDVSPTSLTTQPYMNTGIVNVSSAGNVNLKSATIHADSVNTDITPLAGYPNAYAGGVIIKAGNAYTDTADTHVTANRLGLSGGNAGYMNITAKSAKINGQYSASVMTSAIGPTVPIKGRAGNITIEAPSLTLGKTANVRAYGEYSATSSNQNVHVTRNVVISPHGKKTIVSAKSDLTAIENGKLIK